MENNSGNNRVEISISGITPATPDSSGVRGYIDLSMNLKNETDNYHNTIAGADVRVYFFDNNQTVEQLKEFAIIEARKQLSAIASCENYQIE